MKTLSNQIISGRISHAYLFSGTRGTGKTSAAKAFAKVLNCEKPQGAIPCQVCASCEAAAKGLNPDIIEVDAASNSRVEEMREIIDAVNYPPVAAKKKIYIIDEVHMLSTSAFNAFLKTLEEPPEHAVFILATTDPQKVPVTIRSRCQQFEFRRISPSDMISALKNYMDKENIKITDDALRYAVRLSDGAMRDALSLLDQCLPFSSGGEITLAKMLDATGAADSESLFALAGALAEHNSAKCIQIIDKIIMLGRDVYQFVSDFISHLRDALIIKTADGSVPVLALSEDESRIFHEEVKNMTAEFLVETISTFSELQSALRYSAVNSRILLEVCCIKLCSPKAAEIIREAEVPKQPAKPPVPKAELPKKTIPPDYKKALADWDSFIASITVDRPWKGFLKRAQKGNLGTDSLFVVCNDDTSVSILKRNLPELTELFAKKTGQTVNFEIILESAYNQQHRKIFGGDDDFDYSELAEDLGELLNVYSSPN